MIEKITDFECLSGVSSPLLPLIYTDGVFSQNDLDGAFVQKSDNNQIQAVFSLKNTCVNLIALDIFNFEELEKFFEFCGVTEVLSDKPLLNILKEQKQLNFLEFFGNIPKETESKLLNQKSNINEYENIYKLVFQDGNNFKAWFLEFSKKINSENAKATYLSVNDKIVSSAVAPAVYKNSAIIAGVFTLEEYRKKGYAGDCVNSLLRELLLKNKSKIYLWCENDNTSFYEKLGFKNTGIIFIGECK